MNRNLIEVSSQKREALKDHNEDHYPMLFHF